MKELLQNVLRGAFEKACEAKLFSSKEWPSSAQIDRPKMKTHGDFASNFAIVYANQVTHGRLKPRDVANRLLPFLMQAFEGKGRIEIAGPGFINFFLDRSLWLEEVQKIVQNPASYGNPPLGQGQKVLIEFVSANPTGPLHVGHGRNAAVGDALARILEKAGFKVRRTFYINDVGTQMRAFGLSLLRAKQARSEGIPEEERGEYRGEYVQELIQELQKDPSIKWSADDESLEELGRLGAKKILEESIRCDLERFRVRFDDWQGEQELHRGGEVQQVIDRLVQKGCTYAKGGALWFRSTDYGDDKDRVLIRGDGTTTYFASDVAYHLKKLQGGSDLLINVWGADHHGYPARIWGALRALGEPADRLKIVFIQLVRLVRAGKVIPMSKRQGDYVTLRDLVEEVGVDASRFLLLSHHADSSLDFDIELAKRKTVDNPVFYVQYANARICSVFRKAEEESIRWDPSDADIQRLEADVEIDLIQKLTQFPEVIEIAAKTLEPHRVTYYLQELAGAFHRYYTDYRIITDDRGLTFARLFLLRCIQIVLQNGLNSIGVSAPDHM